MNELNKVKAGFKLKDVNLRGKLSEERSFDHVDPLFFYSF